MNRFGYQVLGFVVWKGARWYLRRRYGDAPRKVAAATAVVLVLVALLLGGRRLAASPD
ncbi:MAG: hypothetical protein ACJ76S_04070 [Solirubrobacteraceae bacterium]